MTVFMKRLLSGILFFCFLAPFSSGQVWKRKRYEVALGIGPSQFFGDIGGFSKGTNVGGLRDMSIPQARFDANLNLKYHLTRKINARISLTYGYLHANDTRGSNIERGFEASTAVFEPLLAAEYYFIKSRPRSSFLSADHGRRSFPAFFESLSSYIFTGIGGLSYSVTGNDKLVSAGLENGGFTTVIPVGLGSTLEYSRVFNIGVEVAGRYSFSDKLDGYSSGYSSSNDIYFFMNLTITYKLKAGLSGLPDFR